MRVLTIWAIAIGAVLSGAACTVHQTDVPPLTGPSDFAKSLGMTVTPDTINLGGFGSSFGQSSRIEIKVLDESGRGVANQDIRLEILVNGIVQDCGTLSSRNVQTGSDGTAFATFTAPGTPLPVSCAGYNPGDIITIRAIPAGTNFQTANFRLATIRMVPQGVILPPPDTPTPQFIFDPSSPAANQVVAFDGSSSCAGPLNSTGGCAPTTAFITSYSWNYGDGNTDSGAIVSHDFGAARTYPVTLTVTNNRGLSSSVTHFVPVGAPAPVNPTASFTATNAVGSPPGQVVVFDGRGSTAVAPATIVSWAWNFGDGTVGSGSVTIHDYAVPGTPSGTIKIVTLTVTDSVGRTNTTSQAVAVP